MIVFLNGQFVPEEEAKVSVFDRAFLYGDGLFETLRIYNSVPFRLSQHLERLQCGAEFLRIALPFSFEALRNHVGQLLERNQMRDGVLRITLSRGVGIRGYSPKGADRPLLVMTLHPSPLHYPESPPPWRVITSSLRVPAQDPVANHKTCNKLHQVLARAEAEAVGADEALLLNTDGEVAEATGSNLFWIEDGVVCTTPLASGILAGVTRGFVLELCRELSLTAQEKAIKPQAMIQAEAVFLTLSTAEIVEVSDLDGHSLGRSPIVSRLRKAYQEAVQRETGGSGR